MQRTTKSQSKSNLLNAHIQSSLQSQSKIKSRHERKVYGITDFKQRAKHSIVHLDPQLNCARLVELELRAGQATAAARIVSNVLVAWQSEAAARR